MKDERIRTVAVLVTVALHVLLVGGAWAASRFEHDRLQQRASLADQNLQHIEAGLAVRSKSSKGRKTRQPQKDVRRKVSPTDIAVSKNDQANPDDKKKDEDPNEEIDPESVFNKHRQGAEGNSTEDPATAGQGSDEESKAGQTDGSDFGTLEKAKGDPYVGELIGRMTTNPDMEVPSTVPEGSNLVTYGCVRLNADGKIVDFQLDPDSKSSSAAFNSAVLRRLKQTTDMETAVPPNLRDMLVEKWACVPYRY